MTKIEWTKRPGTKGESWNFISGCTKVSPGCDSCYALSMSWRLQNMEKRPERYEGVAEKLRVPNPSHYGHKEIVQWTGRVNLDYDALEIPYRWRKPRTVFVASMADLFHEKVPDEFIRRVWNVMTHTPAHTYIVLTKRAKRMAILMQKWSKGSSRRLPMKAAPNIWLMVTAENQEQADQRIPYLLQTPAAVRGISVEPMLSAVDLEKPGYIIPSHIRGFLHNLGQVPVPRPLDWVVCGAESGPNRRPMENEWAVELIGQCDAANVPVFVKQVTTDWFLESPRLSKDPSEWPTELRRREWPE